MHAKVRNRTDPTAVPLWESAMAEQRATLFWQLGKMLHIHYSGVVEEPVPQRWVELISALNEQDRLVNQRRATNEDLQLLVADRHIADGERRVAEQRILISRLCHSGLDSSEAEWLLGEFEQILQEMLRHRQLLIQFRQVH